MSRREHPIDIIVNGSKRTRVIIDSHYEEKHLGSINDRLILELVKTLDGEAHEPVEIDGKYTYFVKDPTELGGKNYRLVWLLEEQQDYIGVVNAHRR